MNYTIKYFPKKTFSIFLLTFLLFINNNAGNSFSMSPKQKLMLGAEKNRVNLIKIAIESGVNINTKDKYGNNALHIAVKFNNIEATQVLIEYDINIDGENKTKNTPLHVAAQRNSVHCLNILLKHGANPNFQNSFGRTPLHIAAIYNPKNYDYEEEVIITFIAKKEIIKLLIFFGANIKIQDEDNRTVKAMTKNIEIKKTINESVKARNRFKNRLQRLKKQLRIKSETRKKTKQSKIIKKVENLKIIPNKSKDKVITTIPKTPTPQDTIKIKPIKLKPFVQSKIGIKAEKERMNELLKQQSKERQKKERPRKAEFKEKERKRRQEINRKKKLQLPVKYLQSIIKTIKTKDNFENQKEKIKILKALLKMHLIKKDFSAKYIEKLFEKNEELYNLPEIKRYLSCPDFNKIEFEENEDSVTTETLQESINSMRTNSLITIDSKSFESQSFSGEPASLSDQYSFANSFKPENFDEPNSFSITKKEPVFSEDKSEIVFSDNKIESNFLPERNKAKLKKSISLEF